MPDYFPPERSAACVCGETPETILPLLASRYIRENPPLPFAWRTFDETGIGCDRAAAYQLAFDARFPSAAAGSVALALGELWCPLAKPSTFLVRCRGPVRIWLNAEAVFTSDGNQERSGEPCRFSVSLREGANRFLIACERADTGFGCSLANAMPQWEPCNYMMPFASRGGAAGFVFTEPLAGIPGDLRPMWGDDQAATGLAWLPAMPGETVTHAYDGGVTYGWTAFTLDRPQSCRVTLSVPARAVWLDGEPYVPGSMALSAGTHQLVYAVDSGETLPVPAVECAHAQPAALHPPVPVHGCCTPWLLLGPMPHALSDPRQLTRLPGVFMGLHGPCVWRTGYANTALRPYVESRLYGRWTYPLGVTLYGLLTYGLSTGDSDIVRYVRGHLRQVTGAQAYALWDTNRYGFAGINQQLCWLDALDDCGSFGAFMLACLPADALGEAREIADTIADYMMERQPRLADGTFVRRDDTLWADDLYMSVPFLCRYGVLTGDARYLDECARQFAGFRRHLYMPEKRVMAHMKCMRRNRKNGIPWSRGNGWVLFSLSELLERLPADHPSRESLLQFFSELSQGVLALQDEQGLWRQILDEPDTYREASSTAMFLCALARGVRRGVLPQALCKQARDAVYRAWKGLANHCIDRDGNLYGVCRGSGFSYSRAYYRGLSWNFNDTHGVGIVILAGVETLRLRQYEKKQNLE